MSPSAPTVTPLATYRNERPYPFCPGCGHGPILDAFNAALVRLGRDPLNVVIVSDIGCSGLSDQYFATSAFHGLHGRSLTYASGISLARPELTVVVAMGDGGTGIGGAHLLNAARRNVDMTVLVFNNFNFGMTGGQHSTTTPAGAFTSTTPEGNLERPLDICATVAVNGAAFVWRGTSFDKDLADRIADAIETPGFALLDIWELCSAYYVPNNRASRKTLEEMRRRLGFESGVIVRRELPEYARAYREIHARDRGRPAPTARPLEIGHRSTLDTRFRLVAAGAAGGRVRSAARLVATAGILSGLWAAQRDDYPVTVKSGHSLSELILAPDEIRFCGIDRPDALLVLSPEGLSKAAPLLARMTPADRVFVLPELDLPETAARVSRLDLSAAPHRLYRSHLSVLALSAVVRATGILPLAALEEAVLRGAPGYREDNLAAVAAGWAA